LDPPCRSATVSLLLVAGRHLLPSSLLQGDSWLRLSGAKVFSEAKNRLSLHFAKVSLQMTNCREERIRNSANGSIHRPDPGRTKPVFSCDRSERFGQRYCRMRMKSNKAKKKRKPKAAEEHLVEVLREIEKAARRNENPTPVADLGERRTGTQANPSAG
jgi:hypothetical protein